MEFAYSFWSEITRLKLIRDSSHDDALLCRYITYTYKYIKRAEQSSNGTLNCLLDKTISIKQSKVISEPQSSLKLAGMIKGNAAGVFGER